MESKSKTTNKSLVAPKNRIDNFPCKTFMSWIAPPSILDVERCVDNILSFRQGANSNFHFDGADDILSSDANMKRRFESTGHS